MRCLPTAPPLCSSTREGLPKSSPHGSMISTRNPVTVPFPNIRTWVRPRGASTSPDTMIPWSARPPCWSSRTRMPTQSPWPTMVRSPRIAASRSRNSSNVDNCVAWWPHPASNSASIWGRWIWSSRLPLRCRCRRGCSASDAPTTRSGECRARCSIRSRVSRSSAWWPVSKACGQGISNHCASSAIHWMCSRSRRSRRRRCTTSNRTNGMPWYADPRRSAILNVPCSTPPWA